MGRKKKYRKDTTNVHPLFSGDVDYLAELDAAAEAALDEHLANLPPPKYGWHQGARPPEGKWWLKLTGDEWAEVFPARPKALRKIAHGLADLGDDVVTYTAPGTTYRRSNKYGGTDVHRVGPIDMLAAQCDVSRRVMQRYLPLFERYGVVEVYRWRHREHSHFGAPAISIRVFRGTAIPADWSWEGGNFPVSARQAA